MVKELQQFDLPHNSLGVNKILKGLGDLLDGDLDFALVVVCRADHTICAVTDLLDVFEFLFYNESRACTDEGGLALGLLELYGTLYLILLAATG